MNNSKKKILTSLIFMLCILVPLIGYSQDWTEQQTLRSDEEFEKGAEEILKEKLSEYQEIIDDADLQEGPAPGYRLYQDLGNSVGKTRERVLKKLDKIRKDIRAVIQVTAREIEFNRDFTITVNEKGLELSESQREKLKHFSDAVIENNMSLRSQALAVKLLIGFNDQIISKAETEVEPQKRRRLYAVQAIYVFELANTIIDLLDSLSATSADELLELYKQEMNEIDSIKERIVERNQRFSNYLDENNSYDRSAGWIRGLNETQNGWGQVLQIIQDQEEWVSDAKSKRELFEKIKTDAGLQLSVLERTMILGEVLESLESFREVLKIDDIPLLSLDAEVVLDLLSIRPLTGEEF